MSYKLISFKLCPFVHRAATLLEYNQIQYDIDYIDLANKPDWFLEISPLGKVPVLCVDGQPLFESLAILEYLDECAEQSLHPKDKFLKARNRAYFNIVDKLFVAMYKISRAPDESSTKEIISEMQDTFKLLEQQSPDGFFNGNQMHFIDVVAAPFFFRLGLIAEKLGDIYSGFPGVKKWSQNLAQHPAVNKAVVSDFKDIFMNYLQKNNAWIAQNSLSA